MIRPALPDKPGTPQQWRVVLTWIRETHWTVIDEDVHPREGGEHALEAMLHWRVDRLRTIRGCRRTSLLDDNPSSG